MNEGRSNKFANVEVCSLLVVVIVIEEHNMSIWLAVLADTWSVIT
jgi:hypothetical protein